MAVIPESIPQARTPSQDLRGVRSAVAGVAASNVALGKSVSGVFNAITSGALILREQAFQLDEASARNEIATSIPLEAQRIFDEERANVQPGAKGFSERVSSRIAAMKAEKLAGMTDKFSIRDKALKGIELGALHLGNRPVLKAQEFERVEGINQFKLNAQAALGDLALTAQRNPKDMPAQMLLALGLFNTPEAIGIYGPSGAEIEGRKAMRTVGLTAIEARIKDNPGAVLAEVKSGKFDAFVKNGTFTAGDISKIKNLSERRVKSLGAVQRAAEKGKNADFLALLTLGIHRGEINQGDLDDMLRRGVISAREFARSSLLVDRVEASSRKQIEAQGRLDVLPQALALADSVKKGTATITEVNTAERMGIIAAKEAVKHRFTIEQGIKDAAVGTARFVALVEGDGSNPYNTNDTKDVTQFNRAFDEHIPEVGKKLIDLKTAAATATSVVDAVGKTGMLPKSVFGALEGSMRIGNPKVVARAADVIDRLYTSNPRLESELRKIPSFRMAMHIARNVRNGVPAVRAVELAREAFAQSSVTLDARKAHLSGNRLDIRDENDKIIKREFGAPSFLGLKFAASPKMEMIKAEFGEAVKQEFLDSGDMEVARKIALGRIKNVFGRTDIGGPRLTRKPPELMYGLKSLSQSENHAWMKEQLVSDLITAGVFKKLITRSAVGKAVERANEAVGVKLGKVSQLPLADKVILSLSPDQARSKEPAYTVLIRAENGSLSPARKPDGTIIMWRPDWETSAAAARAKKAADLANKRAVESARSMRKAIQSGIIGTAN